jgi:prolyl oligopeptidase
MKKAVILSSALLLGAVSIYGQQDDPYLWLEEVDGKKALEFVEKQNKVSLDKLTAQKDYQALYNKSLEIYNSNERIAYPSVYGDFAYNFWQDKEHPRGIWRRSTKASYLSGTPAWETLIDLDKMSKDDNALWVYKGVSGLYPKYERFLVHLSKGGGDAVITREFDVTKKSFIENGFSLPESKGSSSYLDENTVIVSTDFGNNSMTTSGYPRLVKLWTRGSALADAKLIFAGETTDVSSGGYALRDGDKTYLVINRGITFYTANAFVWKDNKAVKLEIPDDSDINDIISNQLIITLKSDWTVKSDLTGDEQTFTSGSLVSLDFTALMNGSKKPTLIYQPDQFSSVSGASATKNKLLLNILSNVKSELYICSYTNGKWQKDKVKTPEAGTIYLNGANEFSDEFFFTYSNFLMPPTLYYGNAADNTFRKHKSLPAFFDAAKYKVEQFKSKSADGTMVPYFVVSSKTVKYDGKNPTLLYAYGGFEVSMLPFYSGITGNAWLENGGVYVLANIRGGGEFGPKWHQAGLKGQRQNIYNDFHSVAEDIIARKITSGKHLGIMGGSNGGLLMGVAFTQRPELYNAVVCQVPLLDMKRYNKLLAGASWMGEYGDPDKAEEWEWIKKYSPYQNLKKDAKYPEVFFTTSTRDDRVHPGHARKMVAKMTELGHPVYYYENMEGGHAGSSTNEQRAKTTALQYSYLLMKLKGETQ